MSGEVVALRPRKPGDQDALWGEFCRWRDALAEEIEQGRAKMETVCACADAYRAWVRAYTWDRTA